MVEDIQVRLTPWQERLAKAAAQRYGRNQAGRLLLELWDEAPSESQLHWLVRDTDVRVEQSDVDYWRKIDDTRKARLQAEFHEQVPAMLNAIGRLTSPDNFEPADIPAAKIQSLAIAAGIFYDKLVPGPRMAGGGISIEGAGTVNLMVIAPTAEQRGRPALPVALENAE